jgi:hypothetical protein
MRMSKLVVALGAAMAVAAAPLMMATSASAASGSNAGSPTRVSGYSAPAANPGACTQIMNPAGYPSNTKLVDLSGIADFTPVTKQNGVSFSPALEKRSVPASWGTWGSPPDTESATPNILYTAGATSITLKFPKRGRSTVGAEVEPNPFEVHTFTAVLKTKGGATLCTITRDADGSAGARVLAATASGKVKTMTISSDVDFAIAQVRSKR